MEDIMKILFFMMQFLITINIHGQTFGEVSREEKFPMGGTFYNTIINDNNVNIRTLPSLTGKKITQLNKGLEIKVIGISPNTQVIDNLNGHWINIALPDDTMGWVFEKYVNIKEIFVSEINVNKNGYGTYWLDNNKISFRVKLKEVTQTQYFIWDIKEKNFHYSCVPGCYVYNQNNNKWELLTYNTVGTFWGFRSFTILTDDLKYFMIDYGTGPIPMRSVIVYRIGDNSIIYDGRYNKEPSKNSHHISVGYKYIGYHFGKWEIENTRLNETLLAYGREYIKDNPLELEKQKPEWKKYDDSFALYINCLYNLDTETEEIVGAYWDHEM
jgi:hypothetical protein